MSISTTGFVVTKDKDVFKIMEVIDDALTELVKKYAKDVVFRDRASSFPHTKIDAQAKLLASYFRINNENRILHINFDCNCDYSEYGDSKIIWSLSHWGMAEEIILAVCSAIKELNIGDVYYRANDAVIEDFVEV